MSLPKITHVALWFRGQIYSLPEPNRHHHIIWHIIGTQPDVKTVDARGKDEGFLDENGEYLTREEALVNALANKQVKDETDIRAGQLFSEDLW